MAWIVDAYSHYDGFNPAVATGKPLELGGSHGRIEATGKGVALITEWAAAAHGIDLDGASAAVQGVGNVGSFAARFLVEKGARIIALSDVSGGVFNRRGLAVEELLDNLRRNRKASLRDLKGDFEPIGNNELLELKVDILIPAAVGGVIDEENAGAVKAGLVVEAANMPITFCAEDILRDNGVTVVPDILANAGGVTVSFLEWVQNRQRYLWSREQIDSELEKRLNRAWNDVKDKADREKLSYRQAAYLIAVARIIKAIEMRGF